MKYWWTTGEYAQRQIRRRVKFDRRARHARKKKTRLLHRPPRSRPRRSGQKELSLPAPKELSLTKKPSETLEYCEVLRKNLNGRGNRIFLDLGNVEYFTSDALLLIRAILLSPRAQNRYVGGNLPGDPIVASEFKASGFFHGFEQPPSGLPPARGLMLNKSEDTVIARMAGELVDFAKEHVVMTRECKNACFQTLVEVMTNTHDHAGNRTFIKKMQLGKRLKWFVCVYCLEGTAYFTFADLGIGILNSAPARTFLQRSGASISSYGRIRLLKEAFEGRIGSVTGNPGRGLGLPRMKQDAEKGRLSDLIVLTSDVVGSVSDLNFRAISQPLRGTLFHWCSRPKELNYE